MKKLLSFIIVAGAFTFASCESKKTEETTATETTTEIETDATATDAVTIDSMATPATTDSAAQ